MKILTKVVAVFLAVSLTVSFTGCAYNHPNPIARDISYGATVGALPGLAMMSLLSESDEGSDAEEELGFFGLSLVVLGGGALIGTALGAIVGTVQWFIETATYDPTQDPNHPDYVAPQPSNPPVRWDNAADTQQSESYEPAEPTAVRAESEDPAQEYEAEPQYEQTEQDYAPSPVRQ